MNDITIFNHLGNDIRAMTDEQGEPRFVAKDVCIALGYTKVSNAITRHLDWGWGPDLGHPRQSRCPARDTIHQRIRPVLVDHV